MRPQPYHKYVFDQRKRKLVGKFEEMYGNEDKYQFDSWFQEDLTHLGKQISLAILNRYSFSSILDIGCGKGAFTHLLKKNNNKVLGTDLSNTAIKKAASKYRVVEFKVMTAKQALAIKSHWDLIIMMEILSYLKDWKSIIAKASQKASYFYVALYLPDNPMGYVKSHETLLIEFKRHFDIIDEIIWNGNEMLLLGKSRHGKK